MHFFVISNFLSVPWLVVEIFFLTFSWHKKSKITQPYGCSSTTRTKLANVEYVFHFDYFIRLFIFIFFSQFSFLSKQLPEVGKLASRYFLQLILYGFQVDYLLSTTWTKANKKSIMIFSFVLYYLSVRRHELTTFSVSVCRFSSGKLFNQTPLLKLHPCNNNKKKKDKYKSDSRFNEKKLLYCHFDF